MFTFVRKFLKLRPANSANTFPFGFAKIDLSNKVVFNNLLVKIVLLSIYLDILVQVLKREIQKVAIHILVLSELGKSFVRKCFPEKPFWKALLGRMVKNIRHFFWVLLQVEFAFLRNQLAMFR